MSLPIFAYYMQKVYADEQLGYSQDEKFDIPEGFDPCAINDNMELIDGEEEGEIIDEIPDEQQEKIYQ